VAEVNFIVNVTVRLNSEPSGCGTHRLERWGNEMVRSLDCASDAPKFGAKRKSRIAQDDSSARQGSAS
jgi:hypothetical protein